MDGVAVLIALLSADSGLAGHVSPVNIMGGPLPQSTTLPAISITSVSRVDRHPISKADATMVRERVQVSVLAMDYGQMKAVLSAVRQEITAIEVGSLDQPSLQGLSAITVRTDTAGPDFMIDEASIYAGSQDYTVTYNEDR